MVYDESTRWGRQSGAPDGVGVGAYRAGPFASADYQQPDYGSRHREADPGVDYQEPTYAPETRRASRRRAAQAGADLHSPYRRPDQLDFQEPTDAGPAAASGSLTDVFDDPAHGEPGRDRMAVHVAWEVVLLVGVGVLAFLLYRGDPAALRAPALDPLLLSAAVLGILVLGAGLTLRAGAPNLALGPVAVASALHYAENSDLGTAFTIANAAAVGAVGGVVLALLVVGLHVPAWAASLGGAFAVITYIQLRPGPVAVQGGYEPTPHALYLFGGFAILALVGGLVGAVRPVRRAMGRFRPVGDPADRRGAAAGLLTGTVLAASMVLAVVAGALLAASSPGPVQPTTGLEWSGLALGTALLAGTSAFGRRGGVFGTLFAVILVVLFQQYEQQQNWHVSIFAIAAGLVGAGVVVTRLIEAFGRPLHGGYPEPVADEIDPEPAGTPWAANGGRQESWGSLPAQPSDARGTQWR